MPEPGVQNLCLSRQVHTWRCPGSVHEDQAPRTASPTNFPQRWPGRTPAIALWAAESPPRAISTGSNRFRVHASGLARAWRFTLGRISRYLEPPDRPSPLRCRILLVRKRPLVIASVNLSGHPPRTMDGSDGRKNVCLHPLPATFLRENSFPENLAHRPNVTGWYTMPDIEHGPANITSIQTYARKQARTERRGTVPCPNYNHFVVCTFRQTNRPCGWVGSWRLYRRIPPKFPGSTATLQMQVSP